MRRLPLLLAVFALSACTELGDRLGLDREVRSAPARKATSPRPSPPPLPRGTGDAFGGADAALALGGPTVAVAAGDDTWNMRVAEIGDESFVVAEGPSLSPAGLEQIRQRTGCAIFGAPMRRGAASIVELDCG